jgi:oligopeptidase A
MQIQERIEEFTTPIFHIDSVKNSDLTQEVYSQCLPLVSSYSTQLAQNEDIFSAMKHIKDTQDLTHIQLKVLDNEIRDFELGGCGLDDNNKKRLEELNLTLSELSKEFSQNLLNATNDFEMICDDFSDVEQIPQSDLELAKFDDNGVEKYKFTLQMPSYIAYMTYGTNRNKREELYKAYQTRALQNSELIDKILKLKLEKANILGFENYASLSLATKTAKNEDEVIDFLYELGNKSKASAKDEYEEVKQRAKKDGIEDFRVSDLAYFSQKLKKENYDLDEEYYRPYFEQNVVLSGFFDFLNKIFNIEFKLTNEKAWDDKVKVYDIYSDNKIISRIYIDLEARSDKRGGAWMNNWVSKYKNLDDVNMLPTAYIVCNFPASTEQTPSLLRHSDVVTLFHEMGHALHHLLTNIDEPFVGGISGVAWDVVEFPSQFLEYFSYEAQVLKMFAKHYETGEILDDEAIERLKKARNFQSSLATVRQLEFAIFDFKLHQKLYQGDEVQELLDNVRKEVSPSVTPKYNKFQNGFTHIFAGGYSAGYYSYKWAEVLSADAFYLFIEKGIFNKELALKYKELIFGKGGSVDMDKLFYEFSGREPKVDSLLKIDGIIK